MGGALGGVFVLLACGTSATSSVPTTLDADPTVLDADLPDVAVDAGESNVLDASMSADADASLCPDRLPDTGDPLGTAIERDAFGCYGACGPSCKADCVDSVVSLWRSDGNTCVRCDYRVKECKSHAFCRWHDDCYRQCDLRWEKDHKEAPATPPSNPCYRTCDNPVVKATPSCAVDWTQIGVGPPSVRDACWDGSWVTFSELATTSVSESAATCGDDASVRPAPWDPRTAKWSSDKAPPATLPQGYSCTHDTDCPDRNEICDPHAGDYPGVNGTGRCEDAGLGVDVAPRVPEGLVLPDASVDAGP